MARAGDLFDNHYTDDGRPPSLEETLYHRQERPTTKDTLSPEIKRPALFLGPPQTTRQGQRSVTLFRKDTLPSPQRCIALSRHRSGRALRLPCGHQCRVPLNGGLKGCEDVCWLDASSNCSVGCERTRIHPFLRRGGRIEHSLRFQ